MCETRSDMSIIKYEDLTFESKIGKGSFGVVWKGKYRNSVVAIKAQIGNIKDDNIHQEIMYMALVKHENIVKLLHVAMKDNQIYLAMEFVDGGSLWHFLHTLPPVPYTIEDGINWLRQAAQALAYLHSLTERSVIHRDVKPPNMLLDSSRRNLKICDFGFVRNVQTQMTNRKGTLIYMAPEVFTGQSYNDKCDVFSMGITIWEVLSRKQPYYNNNLPDIELLKEINIADLRPSLEDLMSGCPDNIQSVIQKCWDKEPTNRPSMQGLVDVLKESQAAKSSCE